MRSSVGRFRKSWQRERVGGGAEELRNKQRYVEERANYKRAIREKRKEWERKILEEVRENEPWARVWEVLRRIEGGRGRQIGNIEEGLDMKDWHRGMLQKHHPGINTQMEREREVWDRLIGDAMNEGRKVVEFSVGEVDRAVGGLEPGKATGSDRIPNELVKVVWKERQVDLVRLFNACLGVGVFPKVWKKGDITWVPKKGGGVRPICLVGSLGRVLDKLLAERVQQLWERDGIHNKHQYGFRRGRNTVGALNGLIEVLGCNKRAGEHSLVVALDLRNAFNTVWGPS